MFWIAVPLLLLQTTQVMPRDSMERPTQQGTASIRGRVVAADTGLPLRRATVTLMGSGPAASPSRPHTVATDAEGRFAFTRLPAGTYRLRAAPGSYRGQYLPVAFGGRRPSDLGTPIELADGQRFDASDVALPRGAAITGRVVDDFGEPVARVGVSASRVLPGLQYQRTGMGFNQTDDLGRFRLYGLEPGEYVLAAEARDWGGGPPPDGPTEGFATTYFPSALSEAEAGRVRVANSDVGDYEIVLVRTRTFRISGTILDSQGRQVMPMGAHLVRATGPGASGSAGTISSEQSGRFTIRNVVPGEYRFVVRPVSFSGTRPDGAPPVSREYANVPLSVTADIDDLVIVTQPGVTIVGRVTFAEGPPAKTPSGLRVFAQPADRLGSVGPTPTALVDASLQFTLDGLFGEQFIRLGVGMPRYAVKAVMLGHTDITDTPIEFKREHSKHLEIVLTSRTSTLEGTVTDEKGEPAANVVVLMIPEDKAAWNRQSPRFRMMVIAQKLGQFSITNVLPGRYYVVAVGREAAYFPADGGPEQFEALTKEATMVVVNEDEKRTVDLRVATGLQER